MSAGKAPVTGLEQARRRRHRRASIVLWIVVALVVGSFGYALAYVNELVPGSKSPSRSCTPVAAPAGPQAAAPVNVYNASQRSGEAGTVAGALESRGFDVGTVGNDPYRKNLSDAGEIRFGPASRAFAERHLVPLVPGATLAPDGRTDSSVDLAIGAAFPGVSKANTAKAPARPC